jgi:dTDP-4-dehydrorhamnose 3,5-epimerase
VGTPIRFVQQNHARTVRGALRGLHAEGWEKLVYVPRGRVFQAVADIRAGSPTFGCVATFELGDENRLSLFLPRGVANGYCSLTDEADYVYLVTSYYDGSDTRAVRWDDPDLAVPWPVREPILSDRDRHNPSLRQLVPAQFEGRSWVDPEVQALREACRSSRANGHCCRSKMYVNCVQNATVAMWR